jgi:signal transduction histidine kinase/ActR/RegA family two-component response regulator
MCRWNLNFIASLNSRLIIINVLAATSLFIISIVFLYKINTLENLSLNKLEIVNNRQNLLEHIRFKNSELNNELSQYLLEPKASNVNRMKVKAQALIVNIENAKVIGGIDLLKLDNLASGFTQFIKNTERLSSLISEITKIKSEAIAREVNKIDTLLEQLRMNLSYQEKYFSANSLYELNALYSALKHRIYSHRSYPELNEEPMTVLVKTLQDKAQRMKLVKLNLSEQEQFNTVLLNIEYLADAVILLDRRINESKAVEHLLFNEHLSPINEMIASLLIGLNKNIEQYNANTKAALVSSRVIIWTLGSLFILLSLLFGWILRRKLQQTIDDIGNTIEKIAIGNFKELQADIKKGNAIGLSELDEFKRIALSVKSIADYQQGMIFDIDSACQELSMGTLDKQSSFIYQGDYTLIEHSLNSNKEHAKKLVAQILATCDRILKGELPADVSSPLLSGEYKDIVIVLNTMSNNLQAQLDDLLKVTRGMEHGLRNHAQFVYPSNCYFGSFLSLQEALQICVSNLSLSAQLNNDQNWLKSGLSDLNRHLTGEQPLETLSKNSIDFIAHYLNAPIGYFYRSFKNPKIGKAIRLITHYGVLMDEETRQTRYKFVYPEGVGLIGQVFVRPEIIVKKLAEGERKPVSQSGIANALLNYIVVVPLVHEERIMGVLELGLYEELTVIQKEFLNQIMSTLGIAMNVAISRDQMKVLLEQSQNQTEELALQQYQLAESNKMLQQKAQQLEDNQQALEEKNNQFEQASITMEEKNHELEQVSQYKSEFLANMSHELRSPLNSLLILSKLLIDNKKGNMDDSEVKYAEIIHRSGSDLLVLIEDILDHAKIEAGKTEINISQESLADIVQLLTESFHQIALDKGIRYSFSVDETLEVVCVDKQRIIQVLTNLLSNAFKFTQNGRVKVSISQYTKGDEIGMHHAHEHALAFDALCFCVEDTGIGIAQENKERVFKAFSQADGTTSRKFGGTGLGLSITQHLVELMEGFLHLETEIDGGSKFYVYLPITTPDSKIYKTLEHPQSIHQTAVVNELITGSSDQRYIDNTIKNIMVIGIAEVDESSLIEVIHDKGFDYDCVSEMCEASKKISLNSYQGVVFFEQSLKENDIDYEQLRFKLNVKEIPVLALKPEQRLDEILNFVSEMDQNPRVSQSEIMQDYFDKTELLATKKVLIVDDHMSNVFALTAILETHHLEYIVAETGYEAIDAINLHSDIDIILMDIMMPDLDGYETIRAIRSNLGYENIPIIALTAKAMPEDRNKCIQAGANDYMTKPLDTQKLLTLMKMWLVTSPNLAALSESY